MLDRFYIRKGGHIVVTGGGDMKTILPVSLRLYLKKVPMEWDKLQEIRMRCDKPVLLKIGGEEKMLDEIQGITESASAPYCVSSKDLQECMAYICQYSLYAYEDQIQKGFVTIRGGHRVGLSGQVVMEAGKVHSIFPVTGLNIRMAHSIIGCGEEIFPYLWEKNRPCHTLIISPPACGKTTLLRDLIRLFSNGYGRFKGQTVGVIDERSEIAACYQGVPQNDVGIRTDVMDHCSKAVGVEMMVRSMAPKIIAFDELGGADDMKAVDYAMRSGCTVLTTMHGDGVEIYQKQAVNSVFQRIVFLNSWEHIQRVDEIIDYQGRKIYKAV